MIHGNAAIFHSADKDAELVLALRVLHQFGLDAKSPHLLEIVARQLHLVEGLAADFDQLVTGHVGIDEIGAVGHEMVGIVHVATLFDSDKVLGGIESALAAGAGQELFHRHVVL